MSAYHQHARRRIDSIESLREHLQWAVEIEHSTLPPYLCALYSLDPARNPAAVEVVTSVLVEDDAASDPCGEPRHAAVCARRSGGPSGGASRRTATGRAPSESAP